MWCATPSILPHAPADDRQLPDLSFAFYDRLVVFDHVTKTMLVIVLVRTEGAETWRRCTDSLSGAWTTDSATGDAQAGSGSCTTSPHGGLRRSSTVEFRAGRPSSRRSAGAWSTSGPATSFRSSSANGCRSRSDSDPFEIYRTLRVINPSPFMFFLRTRRYDAGGQFAGDHVSRDRRQGDRPTLGRHAASRSATKRKTVAWPRSCWPTRRNAPST